MDDSVLCRMWIKWTDTGDSNYVDGFVSETPVSLDLFVLVLWYACHVFADDDDILFLSPHPMLQHTVHQTFHKYYYCHVYTLLTFVPYSTRIILRASD